MSVSLQATGRSFKVQEFGILRFTLFAKQNNNSIAQNLLHRLYG
jgi:hypothetical protein